MSFVGNQAEFSKIFEHTVDTKFVFCSLHIIVIVKAWSLIVE